MSKIICPSCKKEYVERPNSCENCKFPFSGNDKEKAIHIGKFISKKGVIIDSSDSIKKSQNILYAIAAINAVFLVVGFFIGNINMLDVALNLVITLTFLFCGIFIKKSPILLTVIPLVLMIGVNVLNFIVDPSSIFNGIIIKVIIIGVLVYNIYLIKSAKKFKKEFGVD